MRVEARSPRFRVECCFDEKGAIAKLGGPHDDRPGWLVRLQDVFATRGTDFAIMQLNRLMIVCRDKSGKIDNVRLNGLIACIEGAAPQDEVQATLALQMALTNQAALTLLERLNRVDQIPQFDCASNSAVKLLRTYTMQAETLAKLQRGGQQVVKVVHVHGGAQAIVGNVLQQSGCAGGGTYDEKQDQPHAPERLQLAAGRDATQPVSPLLCDDARRDALSVSGGRG